ncbi:Ig-like domain-containing protein, partial [Pseudomonas koreensis]|uniref:Ig-like domain-containing protein n=3 Tax=Pseudomonas TaxID=286 RepID=UPI001B337B52
MRPSVEKPLPPVTSDSSQIPPLLAQSLHRPYLSAGVPAMLVQPKKAIGTLALLAPDIPGAKLLPSGEWAINRAAALLNFPTLGMKVQIPVWSNKSLLDKVELLINDKMVDRLTITQPAELTQRATLFVPPGIFQSGSWDLAYRVTRYNQAPEPFTPPLKLKVKLEIPAGQDTDPGQGHSNLHVAFRPAEIVQDGVDKDTAENGVDVLVVAKPGSRSSLPYPDIAVGDVSWVSWGGKLEPSDPVIQEQIDDPVKNPIIIHISKDIILDKGDSGSEGLAVASFVRDFADNESEDWSKATRIVVDTGNSRLDAPILEQADGNELDLDQLGKEQLLLQVFAASPDDFNQNDTIIMRLQGTTLDGETVQVDARKTIDKKPPLVVPVPMDNDGARALAKTQGVFFFDLERGDSIIQRSRGRFINIIGEPTRLAAPIVESEVGGALNPDLPNVIVRIPYDPLITPDNAIEIHWSITLPDDTVFEPELDWVFPTPPEAEDLEGFIVLVPGPEHLKPGEGGTLVVWYEVLSEDENGEIVRRPSPPASPLNIGEPKFELVRAILLGENDGMFEPKDLPNGISEVTCPDPVNNPTLPKDVVHWRLYDAQDVLLFTDSKTLNSLSAGKAVKFLLDAEFVRQYFEAHRDEQLSIRYHIVRDATGKTSHSNPLKFVVGTAADDKPEITSVMGSQSNEEILNGGVTIETSVTMTGTAAKGQDVKILDGNTDKGDATADPVTGIWSKTVSGLSETLHSFTAKAGYGSGQVSDERNFTVTPVVVPTIDKILDDKGKEILQGETTVSPTVTVSGKASKGQSVEIWEGSGTTAVVLGRAIADVITGIWEETFPLALGPRRLVAKRLYTGAPLWSNDWLLTVVVADPPTLTSVKGSPSNVEIPEGQTTVETSVTLTGAAAKGQKVDVLLGNVSKGQPVADPTTGIWTLTVTGLTTAPQSFTAKALYAPGATSAARTFTVTPATAPTLTSVKGSPSNVEIV